MTGAAHQMGHDNAADGEADGPAGTDPAELERAKTLDLPAHRDQNALQAAAQHQEDHTAQQGKQCTELTQHDADLRPEPQSI